MILIKSNISRKFEMYPKFIFLFLVTTMWISVNSLVQGSTNSNLGQKTTNQSLFERHNEISLAKPTELLNTMNNTLKVQNMSIFQVSNARTSPTNVSFGNDASDSLLRPSFLKSLLVNQKLSGAMRPEKEEEEDVTQTIVVPLSQASQSLDAGPSQILPTKHNGNLLSREIQHKPEASLQLTSTDINSLLNDREAPSFYRERELDGNGVYIGEEQPRLGTAASDHLSGGPMGSSHHGGFGGYDGSDQFLNQRLVHSASEEPNNFDGMFHHRFGQQSAYGRHGGLMQSPNEYSELSAGQEYGHHERGFNSMDYSPNSGLLRAGSGSFGGYEGLPGGGHLPMSPHGSSPHLEQHSSELYGASGGFGQAPMGGGSSADMFNGRLNYAGSQHTGGFPGGLPFTAGDEYSSRFGQFDQQGFASQNNFMMRDNSVPVQLGSHRSEPIQDDTARLLHESNTMQTTDSRENNKLMPLSPVVPVAEEVAMSIPGHDRVYHSGEHQAASSGSGVLKPNQFSYRYQAQPEVHESLDDEGPDSANDEGSEGNSQNGNQFDVSSSELGGDKVSGGSSSDESMTNDSHNRRQSGGNGNTIESSAGPSLVLNYPPPNIEISPQAIKMSQPYVEFSRIGSAGYLPPNRLSPSAASSVVRRTAQRLLRKTDLNLNDYQQNYDPAKNPSHAGKYIID